MVSNRSEEVHPIPVDTCFRQQRPRFYGFTTQRFAKEGQVRAEDVQSNGPYLVLRPSLCDNTEVLSGFYPSCHRFEPRIMMLLQNRYLLQSRRSLSVQLVLFAAVGLGVNNTLQIRVQQLFQLLADRHNLGSLLL